MRGSFVTLSRTRPHHKKRGTSCKHCVGLHHLPSLRKWATVSHSQPYSRRHSLPSPSRFDDEAEHQMPHRTTNLGLTGDSLHAPWLVSVVMWTNCIQFVGEGGVTVRELESLARTPTNLNGMERWRYIVIAPDPADTRPKPPRSDWVIRATAAGRKAQEVWRPLFGVIEQRWQGRFGKSEINQLRESLWAVAGQLAVELPDCFPILKYGLFSRGLENKRPAPARPAAETASGLPLPALLSRVLLAFAIDSEGESEFSLAVCANALRLVSEDGVARSGPPAPGLRVKGSDCGVVELPPETGLRSGQSGIIWPPGEGPHAHR